MKWWDIFSCLEEFKIPVAAGLNPRGISLGDVTSYCALDIFMNLGTQI